MDLKAYIRDIPDFPKPGIMFKDITPLLKSPEAFGEATRQLGKIAKGLRPDKIVAVESRGFIFGAALALALKCSLVPVRKPGKLPYKTHRETYELEYGTDSLEIHTDAIAKGDRVLLIDDLLATGGTLAASARLIKRLGGEVVGILTVVELSFLKGREKLKGLPYHTLIEY
ncbi:MAG: adenine phosphoribosyltransferase [bacterium]